MPTDPLRADFRNFLFMVWKHLGLPPPTRVQYDIANFLQDKKTKRKIVAGFRGVGKSWVTSAYVLWQLHCDADYKALVVSASKQRADDFSTFTKRLIKEIPLLQYLQPKDEQRDSMIAFDVAPAKAAHAPSVKSAGIFGQITGSRATEVIADDIEVLNNSATEDMRDKLFKACLEFEAIIYPDVGRITYLGTPQTEMSIYNKLAQRGYKMMVWPARYPLHDKVPTYLGRLAPWIETALESGKKKPGEPLDPDRFNDVDLSEREASYGRSGFALQFMLDTTLSDADRYPLRLSDLIVMPTQLFKAPISITWASGQQQQLKELQNIGFTGDRFHSPLFVDEKWTEYEGASMHIDPSGRGKDETSYCVLKHLHGNLYLRKWGGLRDGYSDVTLNRLADIAKEEQVKYITIESNFGDGMFTKILTPILARKHPCTMEEIRHNIQKEKRIIDTLEPILNQHRLIVDYDVVKADIKAYEDDINYSGFYQMTRMTRDRGAVKHDDRIDVLAQGVAYWVESMARDSQKAEDEYKDRMQQKDLEVFMKHVIGRDRFESDYKGLIRINGRR